MRRQPMNNNNESGDESPRSQTGRRVREGQAGNNSTLARSQAIGGSGARKKRLPDGVQEQFGEVASAAAV